jgi:hypothetical protein
MSVAKYFGREAYLGEITGAGFEKGTNKTIFRVLYTDGDQEDFDSSELKLGHALFHELEAASKKKQQHGATTPCNKDEEDTDGTGEYGSSDDEEEEFTDKEEEEEEDDDDDIPVNQLKRQRELAEQKRKERELAQKKREDGARIMEAACKKRQEQKQKEKNSSKKQPSKNKDNGNDKAPEEKSKRKTQSTKRHVQPLQQLVACSLQCKLMHRVLSFELQSAKGTIC